MKMNAGFIPALGTPVDENGIFLPESYEKQIDDMLEAGAVAVLVLGSMGMMYAIRQDQYRSVVETAIEAVGGRCPVLVGAMDNSLWRVKERLRYLAGLDIDGIVLTPPYYYASTPDELVRFYVGVAQVSPYNVYMYDLPVVTQTKITYSSIERVLAETDKLKGIKTADQALGRNLILSKSIPSDFSVIYSGLDTVDIAYRWGITTYLDGMFTCTPRLSRILDQSLRTGDYEKAAEYLDKILNLRTDMAKIGIFNSYKHAMNILGYEGCHAPDYCFRNNDEDYEYTLSIMKKHGEID
jgi:4-hydroxy-tetrahydrodipicolinate synthase